MNKRRAIRYLIFILVVGFFMWVRELVIGDYINRFDFRPIQWLSIIVLFMIGAMLACLDKDVFQKENWRFEFKLDVLFFFLVFMTIGFTYIHTWRFVLDMMTRFSQSIGVILHLSQLMSGYIFMQFFLVSEEDRFPI